MRWNRRRHQRARRNLRRWLAYGFPTAEHLSWMPSAAIAEGTMVRVLDVDVWYRWETAGR